METRVWEALREANHPPAEAVAASRQRVRDWFSEAAPLIRWGEMETPLGPLYLAFSAQGLCRVDFGKRLTAEAFLSRLDPLARTERDEQALASVMEQFREYFSGERARFDVPLDMSQMRPFQRRVLRAALQIPAGTVWTYAQVAQAIGKPRATRAVGSALGSNPMPIVIPCHRVIGSDGKLHGYGAGEGLPTKQWLLSLEGAL